ncbi:MAG: hypothetical protein U0936_19350 [Planctomycetaceae bacterium]
MAVVPAHADETNAIWGLKAGDRFVVSVLAVKHTEVTIGDQPATNSDTRDRFEIEYRVTQVKNSGDAVIAARLRKASRDVGEASPDSLKASARSARSLEDLRIGFEIDPTGQILTITERDRDFILSSLSGLDIATSQLLRDSCPEDVIASWLSRPFWAGPTDFANGPPQEGDQKEQTKSYLTRKDSIAIGPFGIMQAMLELEPNSADKKGDSITVTGKGRFAPLVVPNRETISSKIPLVNVTAELDEYSGKILLAEEKSKDETPMPEGSRPESLPEIIPGQKDVRFQSMELNIRLHGSGTLKGIAGNADQKITFRQTQMQSWILTELSLARSEYLFDVPVPIPAAPR